MSLVQEQLVRRALAALCEIADECGEQPARKTLMLRFTLMFTFVAAGADPKKKWIWDSFWEEATRSPMDRTMDSYVRGTEARSALSGIIRESGYAPDMAFLRHLARKRQEK